jgi:hypothetical protein
MPQVGFETTISAGERPQTYFLDRATAVTAKVFHYNTIIFHKFYITVVLFPKESKLFCSSEDPDRLWGPPRLIFNGTERLCIKLTTIDLNRMLKLRMIGSVGYLCSLALGCIFTMHINVTAGSTHSNNSNSKCYSTMVTKCTTCCNCQFLELLVCKQAKAELLCAVWVELS